MLAIIPARGGSKGIIGKNSRLLAGKPLIAHTILAAVDANRVDKIIVSTDSEEIAEIAVKHGAEVPFLRPASISQDDSPILETYNYVLDRFKADFGEAYDSFVALQPTSPFRNSYDIDSAIDLFLDNSTSSVISFTQEAHPIEWNRIVDNNLKFKDIGFDRIDNRQKYEKTYRFNGAVYVYKTELVKARAMYTDKSLAYIMPEERSLDIDTETDFLYAEFLMERMKKGEVEKNGVQ